MTTPHVASVPLPIVHSIRAPVEQVSNFTGLHYNRPVLHDKEEELAAHCEAPDSAYNKAREQKALAKGGGSVTGPLINSHSQYDGHDAQRRSKLSVEVHAELTRLTEAYGELLSKLELPGLNPQVKSARGGARA